MKNCIPEKIWLLSKMLGTVLKSAYCFVEHPFIWTKQSQMHSEWIISSPGAGLISSIYLLHFWTVLHITLYSIASNAHSAFVRIKKLLAQVEIKAPKLDMQMESPNFCFFALMWCIRALWQKYSLKIKILVCFWHFTEDFEMNLLMFVKKVS